VCAGHKFPSSCIPVLLYYVFFRRTETWTLISCPWFAWPLSIHVYIFTETQFRLVPKKSRWRQIRHYTPQQQQSPRAAAVLGDRLVIVQLAILCRSILYYIITYCTFIIYYYNINYIYRTMRGVGTPVPICIRSDPLDRRCINNYYILLYCPSRLLRWLLNK